MRTRKLFPFLLALAFSNIQSSFAEETGSLRQHSVTLSEIKEEEEMDVPAWVWLTSGMGYVLGIAGMGLAYRSYLNQKKHQQELSTQKGEINTVSITDKAVKREEVLPEERDNLHSETSLHNDIKAIERIPVQKDDDEEIVTGLLFRIKRSNGNSYKHISYKELSMAYPSTDHQIMQATILIVTDKVQTLVRLSDILEKDFILRKTAQVDMALEMAVHLHPQLIIYETNEQDNHFLELVNGLHQATKSSRTAILLCDWEERKETIEKAFKNGADAFWQLNGESKVLKQTVYLLLKSYYLESKETEEDESLDKENQEKDYWLQKANEYVEKNLHRTDLTVEELSRALGISRVSLYTKLTTYVGETPIEFIRYIRLRKAASLLREDSISIAEVALRVGFNNPKKFSRYFKMRYGVLPSIYQSQDSVE